MYFLLLESQDPNTSQTTVHDFSPFNTQHFETAAVEGNCQALHVCAHDCIFYFYQNLLPTYSNPLSSFQVTMTTLDIQRIWMVCMLVRNMAKKREPLRRNKGTESCFGGCSTPVQVFPDPFYP